MTTPGITEVVQTGPVGPAGPTAIRVNWTGSAWPARPSTGTSVPVIWQGGTTEPPGALDGDIWITA